MGKLWGTVGLFILCTMLPVASEAQSPHGESFQMRCDACHTSESWKIDPGALAFDHDSTRFGLEGQHAVVDCKACHTTLTFSNTPQDCASCHSDVHQETAGFDCSRCHNTTSWLVNTITELHEQIAFPLLGAHAAINCFDCHISDTDLRFDQIGTACVNCHREVYEATTSPDHKAAGYSTECQECHTITAFEWIGTGISHDFFPLTQGHDINDCARCHTGPDYASTSPDCYNCHRPDYETASEPDHVQINLPTDCATCHTTHPDWQPATFKEHDGLYFPIYSGSHNGEWDQCRDCHTNANDYAEFSCTTCHRNPETDSEHHEVNGYVYDSPACLACHPTGSGDESFDHNKTDFALTGAHTSVDCAACHFNGYVGTPTECVACHDKDFQQSTNPNHNDLGLSTDCAVCHTTDPEWNPAAFPVHDDFYVLAGAHVEIATQCATCHNGDYNNTPSTCVGCHLDNYNATTNPSHVEAQFATDCATCHSESAWQPATFDHDAQYFPIYSGKHLGEWDQCVDCHSNPSNYAEFDCITCHTNPETDDEHHGVNGYAYNNPACLGCHPTGEKDGFNHDMTDFALTGAHTMVDCISCHASGYIGTPTQCAACHTTDFEQANNPNHASLGFSTDCATCHTTDPGWSPADFPDHDNVYTLAGAHVSVAMECTSCHNGDYNNTPNTCVGCHIDDFNNTMDPDHAVEGYPTDCTLCHSESMWQPSTFDHALTNFPLTGAHNTVDCAMCHAGGYTSTPTECVACHTADFEQTTNPNHTALGLSTDCAICHTTDPEWNPAVFPVHNEYYVLQGAHAAIATECVACHNGEYNNTPNTCVGCHLDNYNSTTDPDHQGSQFPTECILCHNETAWQPANLDHNLTDFPLTGAHVTVDCASCHTNGYTGTPTDCAACHISNYNSTTDPDHQGSQFPTECILCHNETAWEPANLDHNLTDFPLVGAHVTVDCASCHTNGYTGTPTDCAACHISNYNSTTDPDHQGSQFPTECILCHNETAWQPANLDHNLTDFPLTGAHVTVDCASCHTNGYTGTPTDCAACHITDYNGSTNPNHGVLGLSTDCATCHTTDPDWNPATFPVHNDYYVLEGAHATIANDCVLCHNGDYNNTPNTCVGCHIDDFNSTTDPDHQAEGYPTDCIVCHSQVAWSPSSFDHNLTDFPLVGAHTMVDCASCHASGYSGTPTDCASCHISDYNNTNDPDHQAEGYPTDCIICHSQTAWSPSSFDHNLTAFPLTGAHTSVDCASCHTSGYSGTPTDCASCHISDYNGSTNPNHGVLGLSTDCATCHTTDPDWNPATFPVHDTYYVLQGAHAAIANDCVACHNGDYNNTPNTCVGCHISDYNSTTDPDHQAEGYPTDCILCHSEMAWSPSSFDHNLTAFPLTGAHTSVNCASCHTSGYSGTPTDCASCHISDYNGSTNPNHGVLGLSTDCATCHTTDPDWNPATFPVHNNYYVLQGAHAAIANDCIVCHNGDYNNTPNTCVGCHIADYNNTSDPDHQAEGYPTDCTLCHSETAWSPSSFDHNLTAFPLTGSHTAVDCASCHAGGYSGTPTDCASCHISDYNGSTNPNHGVLGLSTDCATCHTTDPDWNPATFPVHNNYYVLQGAHAAIANNCVVCHNGDYNNTPNTCVGCHLDDYNNTNDPDHQSAQFPTDCESCHSQNAWVPSTFDHDNMYFPIYSGKHDNEWNQCSDCHTNPNDYSVYTCVTCHTPGETNGQHIGIPGYVYESSACYFCHPTGEADN